MEECEELRSLNGDLDFAFETDDALVGTLLATLIILLIILYCNFTAGQPKSW